MSKWIVVLSVLATVSCGQLATGKQTRAEEFIAKAEFAPVMSDESTELESMPAWMLEETDAEYIGITAEDALLLLLHRRNYRMYARGPGPLINAPSSHTVMLLHDHVQSICNQADWACSTDNGVLVIEDTETKIFELVAQPGESSATLQLGALGGGSSSGQNTASYSSSPYSNGDLLLIIRQIFSSRASGTGAVAGSGASGTGAVAGSGASGTGAVAGSGASGSSVSSSPVGPGGSTATVEILPSINAIQVTASPSLMRSVERAIDVYNKRVSKVARVHFAMYEVVTDAGRSVGATLQAASTSRSLAPDADIHALREIINKGLFDDIKLPTEGGGEGGEGGEGEGEGGSDPIIEAITSRLTQAVQEAPFEFFQSTFGAGLTDPTSIFNLIFKDPDSKYHGSSLILNFLNRLGSAHITLEDTVEVRNNRMAQVDSTRSHQYIARITTSVDQAGVRTRDVEIDELTTGWSITLQPTITEDDITVRFALSRRSIANQRPYEVSGTQGLLYVTDDFNRVMTVTVKPGESRLLTSLNASEITRNKSKLLGLVPLSRERERASREFVLMMTIDVP